MSTSTRQRPAPHSPEHRIDPRIRRRRAEVARSAGRRRLRLLVWSAAALAAVAGGAGLTRTAALDLDRVVVHGSTRTPPERLRTAAGLIAGTPMTDLRPGEAARRLESLPWVDEATVRRRWPGTVEVTVTERIPAAALAGGDGTWAVVDLEGRVLEVVPAPPPALAHVHGAGRAVRPGANVSGRAVQAVRAAAAMPLPLRRLVGGINLTPGGIELGLTLGKGVVRLGDADRLEEKLRAAATVLARVRPHEVAVLDVRVPRAPVLTRQ